MRTCRWTQTWSPHQYQHQRRFPHLWKPWDELFILLFQLHAVTPPHSTDSRQEPAHVIPASPPHLPISSTHTQHPLPLSPPHFCFFFPSERLQIKPKPLDDVRNKASLGNSALKQSSARAEGTRPQQICEVWRLFGCAARQLRSAESENPRWNVGDSCWEARNHPSKRLADTSSNTLQINIKTSLFTNNNQKSPFGRSLQLPTDSETSTPAPSVNGGDENGSSQSNWVIKGRLYVNLINM